MSVYELLSIFQLGMSRMAVIVPGLMEQTKKPSKPCWTATQRTNACIFSRIKAIGSQADWTTEWASGFLEASQMDIQGQMIRKENVVGVRLLSAPVGIITFEDIIDTIIQKTSRDERDFFDRDDTAPPTKKRKAGDVPANRIRITREKENSDVLKVRNFEVSIPPKLIPQV
jgi:metal transporter CNNM